MAKFRDLKRYIPEKSIVSARDLNDIARRLKRLEKLSVSPPLSIRDIGGNPLISLSKYITDVTRFELQEDLNYNGTVEAVKILFRGSDTFVRNEDLVILVKDAQGIFTGQGRTNNRNGDMGYAVLFQSHAEWEIISMQHIAHKIQFALEEPLTTGDEFALAIVERYWQGRDPSFSEESSSSSSENTIFNVYNLKGNGTEFVFFGSTGNRGIASWDEYNKVYRIDNIEC